MPASSAASLATRVRGPAGGPGSYVRVTRASWHRRPVPRPIDSTSAALARDGAEPCPGAERLRRPVARQLRRRAGDRDGHGAHDGDRHGSKPSAKAQVLARGHVRVPLDQSRAGLVHPRPHAPDERLLEERRDEHVLGHRPLDLMEHRFRCFRSSSFAWRWNSSSSSGNDPYA